MRCCKRIFLAAWCALAATGIATGAELERLTRDGRLKFTPQFIDDGRAVAWVELVNPTLYQIRRMSLPDGMSEALHAEAATSEFEPSWSADGTCHAFLKTRGALSVSIVTRDATGTILGEILPGNGFAGYRSPAVAPDLTRVAFSYGEKGSQHIFTARLDGSDRKQLTEARTPAISNWPSYTPDGQTIVFSSSRDGNFEIYRMHADGGDLVRLTDSPRQDIRPRVSRDGHRIAFTSARDGNLEVYVMRLDGSALTRVTDHAERDDYPDWNPDGDRLIFVGEREGKFDLYVVGVGE